MSKYGLPSKESFQEIVGARQTRQEATREFVIGCAIKFLSKYLSTDPFAADIIVGVPYYVFVSIQLAGENSADDRSRDLIKTEVPIDVDSALKECCLRLNEDSQDFHFEVERSQGGVFGSAAQYMFTVKLKPKPGLLDRLLGLVLALGG